MQAMVRPLMAEQHDAEEARLEENAVSTS